VSGKRQPRPADSVLEALGVGVPAARMALARRLASEIDSASTPSYVRASLSRVLADLLEAIEFERAKPAGVEARRLLEEVIGDGRN
jgi:hypothetical protein